MATLFVTKVSQKTINKKDSNLLPLPIFKDSFFKEDDVAIFLEFIFELNKLQSKQISSLILKTIRKNRKLGLGKLDLDQI
ncbi:MAG: hypothetical protein ACK5P5_06645 [Pseudobdellovibrionaceae bacterium]